MPTEVRRLINCLREVRGNCYNTPTLARRSNAKTEKLFNLIFDLGVEKHQFTLEELSVLGPFFVDAIKPLKKNIQREGCIHRTRLNSTILRKRSALQFLIDNYGNNCTVGNQKLNSIFASSNLEESIQILDHIIKNWADLSDSDEGDSDKETSGIPSSHTWWFR